MKAYRWGLGFLFFISTAVTSATPLEHQGTHLSYAETRPGMIMEIQEPFREKALTLPRENYSASRSEKRSSQKRNDEKLLYLTFDDGPVEGTQNLLDVLEEEGVQATMFCVGRHALKRKNILLRELQMPNLLVANHTYSHANGHYSRFYSNLWNVMSDVEHAQLILGGRKYLRLAGRNVWRLPEVARNDAALSPHRRRVEIPDYNRLSKEGFYIYGWDVEWRFDHNSGRPVSGAKRLADRISSLYRHQRMAQRNKVVLLAHDFMFRDRASAEQLRQFIHIMRSRGWSFRKINHYSRFQPQPLYVAKYYGKPVRKIAEHDTTIQKSRSNHQSITEKSPVRHAGGSELSLRERKTIPTSGKELQLELNEAIRGYDAKKVDELIRKGARINQPDRRGRLAINTAVRANSIYLVKKLLAMGANLHAKDTRGRTPIVTARSYKRYAIEKYLIQYSLSHGEKKVVAVNEQQPQRVNPLKLLSQR